ncbi:hypothetical protein CRG98_000848 [Punica granatum]|uniref:Uncharacterized protein n=1 Tax=Punica granatum TaxID=22663 RepID=A0A2I0LDL5_PUNGR|nr:hypothetical protein CRG98_000848 [Punica granatum]
MEAAKLPGARLKREEGLTARSTLSSWCPGSSPVGLSCERASHAPKGGSGSGYGAATSLRS